MADKEIPELTDGGAVEDGDLVHVVRGPNSRKAALGSMAAEDVGDYTPTSELAAVATSNEYGDLDGKPTLGSAAAADTGDFATAAQGSLADTAVQPGDLGDAAFKDTGTGAGDVAAGNHTHAHFSDTNNPHSVTKTQVGLGNVTNDAQLPLAGGTMTGNIAFSGSQTVDGRDVSADGSKLDGIEAGADVTDAANVAAAGAAMLAVENQTLTGGATVTSKSLGTITTGTVTLDMGDRPLQHLTRNGAFTLAPGSVNGMCVLDITNGASAGAITTSGWTNVAGDDFTTTNGHKFRCHCSVGNGGSLLVVQALQ